MHADGRARDKDGTMYIEDKDGDGSDAEPRARDEVLARARRGCWSRYGRCVRPFISNNRTNGLQMSVSSAAGP